MNKLNRYIFWQLLTSTLLVTVSLVVVIWLAQSLRFVELIINRGLSAGMFFYLVGLLLPDFLASIIPFSLFASVMFTYNRMVHDRELVVMRSAGMSQLELMKPALILSAISVLLLYSFHLYVVPASKAEFRDLRLEIQNGYSHIVLQEGTFNTLSKNVTVYIRERTKEGEILGILARDSRDPAKPFTLMADRGALVRSGDATRIVMYNGNRQELNRGTNAFSILYFDKYVFDLEQTSASGKVRYRESGEMSVSDLLNIENIPGISAHDFGSYRVAGHARLTAPLYALTFPLIGLAALISGGFTRRTMTRRIVIATLATVLIQIAAISAENIAAKNLSLISFLYITAIAPAIFSWILIFKKFSFSLGLLNPNAPRTGA